MGWSAVIHETAGYFAMLAFLAAYLLNVAGLAHPAQVILNVSGAVVGASYLRKKRALPGVISNLVWAAITIVGSVIG